MCLLYIVNSIVRVCVYEEVEVVLASFQLLSMMQPKAGEDPRNEDCGDLMVKVLSYSAHDYDCMYIYIYMFCIYINHILIQCQYIYSHRKVCNYFCNCTGRKASDWTKNTKATEPCKA